MHSAPSVSYPVGRSRVAMRWLWGIWFGGAVCVALAVLRTDGMQWRTFVLISSVLLAGVLLCLSLPGRNAPAAQLRFDGQDWSMSGAAPSGAGRVEVSLDFQFLMLIGLNEPGRRRWLWLERASFPQRWVDLRRAVYSRAPSAQADVRAATAPAVGASSFLS